jgi:phosphoribosylaminoimidazole-succinocarboxamide synthase
MAVPPKRTPIYEGKAKIIYQGLDPDTLIQHFKDDATAFNNQKKGTINGKGVLNNRISEYLMVKLAGIGIKNHFIRSLNMREQLVYRVDIIPIEVVVRNVAAGSLCKRLGMEEGTVLPKPLIEFYFKSDELGDPLVGDDHIITFNWANIFEIEDIKMQAIRVNDFLSGLFLGVGLRLVDFKMEFGRLPIGEMEQIILADEISPDSCRLWDIKTNEKMDKDRFRQDLGGISEAYIEVARRLGVLSDTDGENIFNKVEK